MISKKKQALALVIVAIPAGAHAAHAKSEQLRREADLARMTEMLTPLGTVKPGMRIVILNGARVGFETTTVAQPIDAVMQNVDRECRSGRRDVALAGVVPPSGEGSDIELAHVDSQSAGDLRATLCTFDAGRTVTGGRGDLPRVRYTLAQRISPDTTRVVTVVNASNAPLEAMFPADGDAPGSDLAGVPRPEASKRTLTAVVDDGEHAVRMYETEKPVAEAMRAYDRQMDAAGWDTTASLTEARMFRKEGRSIVASFYGTDAGTTISVAPFERE